MKQTPGFPLQSGDGTEVVGGFESFPPSVEHVPCCPPSCLAQPPVCRSKHRLEMADAVGFASLSPRRGIICPVILGQCIPTQLRLEEGRGRPPGSLNVLRSALRLQPCLRVELSGVGGVSHNRFNQFAFYVGKSA